MASLLKQAAPGLRLNERACCSGMRGAFGQRALTLRRSEKSNATLGTLPPGGVISCLVRAGRLAGFQNDLGSPQEWCELFRVLADQ